MIRTSLGHGYTLDPRGDATVARHLGRHETRALAAAERAAEHTVAETVRSAVHVLERKGRFSREDLTRFHGLLESAYRIPGLAIAHSSRTSDLAAVAGANFDSQFVHLSPANVKDGGHGAAGHVQIRLTTIRADRNSISVSSAPFVCDWRHHAAERLHMRWEERGDAHAAIGARMLETYRLINHLSHEARKFDINLQVPVPMEDGLLIGALHIAQPGVAVPSLYGTLRADPIHGPRFAELPIEPIGRGLTESMKDEGRVPRWSALTFYKKDDMTPERLAYAAGFERLQEIARTADLQPNCRIRQEHQDKFELDATSFFRFAIDHRVMKFVPMARDMLKPVAVDLRSADLTPMRRGIVAAKGGFAEALRRGRTVFDPPRGNGVAATGAQWRAMPDTPGADLIFARARAATIPAPQWEAFRSKEPMTVKARSVEDAIATVRENPPPERKKWQEPALTPTRTKPSWRSAMER